MPDRRARMEAAAMSALSIPLAYAERGSNLSTAALAGARSCLEYRHYPFNDVVDTGAGTRFFYHAHPLAQPGQREHGHFHLFLERTNRFHHLAALSLDPQGRPVRWFSTNRWVTGEHWLAAPRWEKPLADFAIHARGRMAPIADWLTAMVSLYRAELLSLLRRRDARLEQLSRTRPRQSVWNDQQLHVLSQIPISLEAQVGKLLKASATCKETS